MSNTNERKEAFQKIEELQDDFTGFTDKARASGKIEDAEEAIRQTQILIKKKEKILNSIGTSCKEQIKRVADSYTN